MTATVEMNSSDKDLASTLVLLGEDEFVLRASRARVVFEHYNRDGEATGEQSITLNLDNGHAQHADSPADNASVPIILSPPSTPRFEFKRPEVSESDYAWDNFQDQVVVHTRLSKLVIRLEAWKNEALSSPRDRENNIPWSLKTSEANDETLSDVARASVNRYVSSMCLQLTPDPGVML
ncbi:uncharacterized protein IUM83_08112 [Phytophthora cinnamomi]|uniref:uncharacterized protein n=1 Tax=Phytophthora cinnamomi TaxID=4785 RepID=UPI0035598CE6|nr:hypothetical protein IUM83_08112 [Phytophthora cinnamomi]